MAELKSVSDMIGKRASIATTKQDGSLFWQTGQFEGETSDVYFVSMEGKIVLFPKSRVVRIEFDIRPAEPTKA